MVLKKVKIFGIIVLLFSSIYAQKIDSAYVTNKNIVISNLRYEGKFNKAYQISKTLLKELENSHLEPIYFAQTYFTKARIEIELGKYEASFQNSNKALKIYQNLKDSVGLAKIYNIIGVCYYYQNNLDSTLNYYRKSFELKKKKEDQFLPQEMAVSAYNLAMVYEDTGLQKEAMDLYQEAEKYLLLNSSGPTFLADVYVGIAHIYKYNNDLTNAEKYAEKALDIALQTYGEMNPNVTFIYTSNADILSRKRNYKEAIELIKKNVQIRERHYGPYHKWTCESYTDLAELYEKNKQYNLAEENFKKALHIGEKTNSKLYLAHAKTSLAIMYCNRKIKAKETEQLLKEAIDSYEKIYGVRSDYVALAKYYLAKNELNKNNEQAFFNYIKETKLAGNYDANDLNNITSPFQVLDVLMLEGDWYQQQYDKTSEVKNLHKKYDLINYQVALIRLLQKNYSSEISKISFANDYRSVFESGLNTCWALYHQAKDKKYLEKAFSLSEMNRNSYLYEELQDAKHKYYSGIPDSLLQLEKSIKQKLMKTKMDLYYEKSSSNPDKEFYSKLLNDRIVFSHKLDSLYKIFNHKYPRYTNLKYQNKAIKITDIQNELDENTQLITYFLGDNNLYTFNITKENVTLLKGNIANNLIERVHTLKSSIINQKNADKTSRELFLYLMKQQINFAKEKMVIVPDNVLSYIPFEILKDENNNYLIQNFTISYAGSVRLFLELKDDYFQYDNKGYWLGFSPVFFGIDSLSSANDEVALISKMLSGKKFLGEQSKKESFYKNKDNFSILHLATHAKINNDNPQYNKLIFSDGELTSSEISISNIRANLAVLSACNTGFGKLEKGEGVISMARAFNFAGVPSIIMSLWKIPDKETKKIMVSFYEHLNKGESKSEALKHAKLDYLANTKDVNLRHPYYWSGFVLNGNTKPLKKSYTYYYYFGIALVIGLTIYGVKKKLFS